MPPRKVNECCFRWRCCPGGSILADATVAGGPYCPEGPRHHGGDATLRGCRSGGATSPGGINDTLGVVLSRWINPTLGPMLPGVR